MTHLDPDPLYIADDEEPWTYLPGSVRVWINGVPVDERPSPSSPSLTVPLVLLCAVVGAVFVAWLVTR